MLKVERPREEAIAALASRGRAHDGKGGKGVSAEAVYDKYASQVSEIRSALEERAGGPLLHGVWREVTYEVAASAIEEAIARVEPNY